MTTPRRLALRVAAACLLLTGCGAPGAVTPTPTVTAWPAAECRAAAAGVGQAVQRLVEPYNTPLPAVVLPTAPAAPAEGDADVQSALDVVRRAVAEHGCPGAAAQADVERGLAAVEARGAIAEAVRDRVLAGLRGRIGSEPAEVALQPGADLAAALAEAPAGSTLRLAAGEYPLASALVLLDAVTLRGEGRDVTVLASRALEAAVLVLADDRVELADLAVVRAAEPPGSGVVAGGAASVVLEGVRVSGARAGAEQGGAGVLMVDADGEASGRGTTLEVTNSVFSDNDWAGLAVSGGHRVSIVTSTFADNGECGLCFLDASDGSVRDSVFDENLVGVAVTGTARPALLGSTVTGGEIGLQVEGEAAPTVDGNRISGASRAAVIVTGSATGTLARTVCSDVPYGLVVSDSAAPTLIDNQCVLARGA